MKERPILFSAPMVRALLDGSKTQTRRAVKPQPPSIEQVKAKAGIDYDWIAPRKPEQPWRVAGPVWAVRDLMGQKPHLRCPYGQPGDRLWVRESWSPDPPDVDGWGYTAWAGCREGQIAGVPERFRHPRFCNYAADWLHGPIRWTPSIHMPRWASRITLEVTAVRVERLQDISEADVIAEGASWAACGAPQEGSHRADFARLWESINGPDSWTANPWVWAISFKRLEPA